MLKILIRNSQYSLKFISKPERKEPFRSALTAAIPHGGGKVNVLRCLTCDRGALGFHLAAIRLELQRDSSFSRFVAMTNFPSSRFPLSCPFASHMLAEELNG